MSSPADSAPTWALLLKKAPAAAKSRLASVLSPAQRETVVEKLFQHVLDAVLATAEIDRVAVISPMQPRLPKDERGDVLWIEDRSGGINQCVVQGIRDLATRGAARVLVLPADLPLVAPVDLAALVRSARDCDMVIAPDEHRVGTNALLVKADTGFRPGFGLNSFEYHLVQAQRLGLETRVVDSPGLGFDLDDERDWRKLRASQPQNFATIA